MGLGGPVESGQRIQLVGMALLRGLVDEVSLQKASNSGGDLLEALRAQGSLDEQDLEDLQGLIEREEKEREGGEAQASFPASATDEAITARGGGEGPWDSLPSGGEGTDGTGRQVLRVLTLPAWRHYRNLRFVAEGGMGRVFKAFDPSLKRVVALKFLRREDPDLVARFVLEAQNQAKVEHPNICKVFEVGEWQGQSYIAMQFIKGETLESAAAGMSLLDKVKVLEAVAEAVHAAHRQGLIHRDLKPANIMVEVEERGPKPMILDFGLAKGMEATGLTVQGLVIGTTHYMAPEQARGDHEKVGRRTDVYGLGATLHKVLTGQAPFAGTEGVDVIRRTLEEDVPSLARLVPDLPEDLDTVVRKCLEKEPGRRYESALAVAEDLRRWREGEPILARKPTLRYRTEKWARRHRLVVMVGTVGVVAILAFAGLGLQARLNAKSQARWSQHFAQSAERMEALARYIHLSPPHDLGPELHQLRALLNTLEADLARAGRQGEGPGAYALGRVHLVLGGLDEAQRRLEQAEALGFITPEAQYALGRVLSLQYQKGLQRILQISDPSLRKIRMKALESQLARATACLQRGQGNALEPLVYQEGLLALFARRYDEALDKARAALQAAPWFYEALALQADVHMARAREVADPVLRNRDLADADTLLQAALHRAPSDPRLAEAMARHWNERIRLAWDTGKDLQPLALAQGDALRRWEALMPGDPGPKALEAWTQADLAQLHQYRGQNPGAWVQAAQRLAEESLQAEPANLDARVALAAALRMEGVWKLTRGEDPTSSLGQALLHCRKGLASSREHPLLLETLVRTTLHLTEYLSSTGQDLGPIQELIQEFFPPQALEGDAGPFLAFNLSALHIELADADLRLDRDPRPRLQRALELLERSRGQAGDPYTLQYRLGNAHLVWGEHLGHLRLDPSAEAQAAKEAYRAALRANPERYDAHWGLVEAHLIQARYLLGAGGNPMGDLEQGRKSLEAIARLDPTTWSRHRGWGESLLLEAEWRVRRKQDPGPVLAQAQLHAEKAVALNGRRPELWVLMARIHRFRLERLQGGAAARSRALQALDRALAIDPRHGGALRERAGIQVLQSS